MDLFSYFFKKYIYGKKSMVQTSLYNKDLIV